MKTKFGKTQLQRILQLQQALSKMEKPPILMVYAPAGFTREASKQLRENGILYGK